MLGRVVWLIVWLTFLLFIPPAIVGDHEFRVSFSETARREPYSGRVYLFFGREGNEEPRLGPDWFHPDPFVALYVENWKVGEHLTMGTSSGNRLLAFPRPLSELDLSGYRVQAVA